MIRQIVIHRFRGIRAGALNDVGKINVLIGPNNSGKSALLELLYLGGVCGRPVTLFLENLGGGIWDAVAPLPRDFLGYEPLPRIRKRHGEPQAWKASPASVTPEGGLRVELEEVPSGHPLQSFRMGVPPEKPGEKSKAFRRGDVQRVAVFGLLPQAESFPSRQDIMPAVFAEHGVTPQWERWYYLWDPALVYKYDLQSPLDRFAIWALETDTGQIPDAEKILFVDFHTVSEHLREAFVLQTFQRIPDWYEKIYERLLKIFPALPGDASLVMDEIPGLRGVRTAYIRIPGQPPLSVDHFGDGTRYAFTVLAGLTALAESVGEGHPGLFLWEDPELFMHPASLGRLLKEVVLLIASKPIQVFLTTQSLELLILLMEMMESPAGEVTPSDFRTFHLSLEGGRLAMYVFRGLEVKGWLEFVGDPRLIGEEDEMASPFLRLLLARRRAE